MACAHKAVDGDIAEKKVNVGFGFDVYTETDGGVVKKEPLSEADILDHELVHAEAQTNGESIDGGTVTNTYSTGNGSLKKETMAKEEAATLGIIQRPSAKGINYTNENNLRREQHKSKHLNYNPD